MTSAACLSALEALCSPSAAMTLALKLTYLIVAWFTQLLMVIIINSYY